MRNTGILLFLAGIYIVINSGSLRDLVFGKATISFLNPKDAAPADDTGVPVVNSSTGFVTSTDGTMVVNDSTGFVTYG